MKPAPTNARPEGPARGSRLAAGRLVLAVCAAVYAAACAGAGADEGKPAAVISQSLAAEGELKDLLAKWARSSRAERQAMEPALVAFRQRHPEDELSRLVEALLSWIQLDRGELHVAEVRARQIRTAAGPGTVGDVARTVEGAALRRQGRAEAALELLLPLQSKLIDPWARALYNQEALACAVEAGRWSRALALMRVWLREAGLDERATARARIEQSLERVPPPELVALLDDRRHASPSAEEDVEMRKLVAQRLAFVARDKKDPELARHLLATAGGFLGDQGDAVAQLAAGASRARVEARTVGLLLSLRSDRTRQRGTDIVDGVAFGLGLPGSKDARLVSRDDHGSPERLEEALSSLSADGASVVIAGSDEQEATTAAAFAEAHHIPVLLLRPPAPGAAGGGKARFAFVVGPDPADVEAALAAALAERGASPVAVLSDAPAPSTAPRPPVVAVRGCDEPPAPWKGVGVLGLVIAAEPDCGRDALAAAAPQRVRVAAGFASAMLPLPPGSLVATAGGFPFARDAKALGGWLETHLGPPSWWAALARDAAVLAWAGVERLPPQSTEDPGEVEARRAQATATLAGAHAALWTSGADGFGGGRVLPRVVGAREIAPAARVPARR